MVLLYPLSSFNIVADTIVFVAFLVDLFYMDDDAIFGTKCVLFVVPLRGK
jgi:hypothetical protein